VSDAAPQDLSLSEFLNETTQELTHLEGKLPTTLMCAATTIILGYAIVSS
jgi:hypothetical protein